MTELTGILAAAVSLITFPIIVVLALRIMAEAIEATPDAPHFPWTA